MLTFGYVTNTNLTFSQTVSASVAKGWGQGDQRKMMAQFKITRAMADKVADECENEYVALHREKWKNATPDRHPARPPRR